MRLQSKSVNSRKRKATLKGLLERRDEAGFRAWVAAEPQAQRLLILALYWPDDCLRWRALEALGWAAGTVVYDSLNPTMDNQAAFDNYTARIIAPLETLTVSLPLSAAERTAISPATGITKVDRTVWRFTGLSASLQKRVFYDPLDDKLGISGFVNDKTLGDDSLTAAPGSVGTADGCESVVRIAIEALGGLDVLVNNAGVCLDSKIEDADEATWDETLDVNLKGTFFCVRAALSELRKNGGTIVNVASVSGLRGSAESAVYCASKGGVVNLTRALAMELAPDVRVNCVCPGWVDTDMLRRDYVDLAPDPAAAERAAIEEAPLNRVATPEEVAKAISYLASDAARFITGAALPLDGGMSAGL